MLVGKYFTRAYTSKRRGGITISNEHEHVRREGKMHVRKEIFCCSWRSGAVKSAYVRLCIHTHFLFLFEFFNFFALTAYIHFTLLLISGEKSRYLICEWAFGSCFSH